MVMPLQPQPLFTGSDGGPGSYEEEFLLALVPAIEGRYRVVEKGGARGLVGVSRGGVWALEIAFRNPEVVGSIAALSPALEVNFPRPAYDPQLLGAEADWLPTTIFLGVGQRELKVRQQTIRLSESLEQAGFTHRLMVVPGGHEPAAWRKLMGPMMTYILQSWMSQNLAGWPPPTQDGKILVQ
jgi:enterochelin esterase-like enzyme